VKTRFFQVAGRLPSATLLFFAVLALSAGAQAPPSPHGGARPGFSAFGSLLRVPADFPTIQQAIDAASDHDLVLVGPGTYHETIDFLGKNIVVKSAAGRDATVIDGTGLFPHVVTFQSGETAAAALIGFTVTGGVAAGGSSGYGYGVYCFQSSPRIEDNMFQVNDQGIDITYFSSPIVRNNLFRDNLNWGILVGIVSTGIVVENNLITRNGGGIAIGSGSEVLFSGNAVVSNESDGVSGNGLAIVEQSTIVGNGNDGVTGAQLIRDSIVAGNGGNGVGSAGQILFTDSWANGIADFPLGGAGAGSFSADPLFEAHSSRVPGDYPTVRDALYATNDFRLGQGSPAIGAGSQGQNMGARPRQKIFGLPGFNDIQVDPGTYPGTVTLTPWTRLTGAGSGTTFLTSPSFQYRSVVDAFGKVPGICLRGFTIQGDGLTQGNTGVNCRGTRILLEDLLVKDNSTGILWQNSEGTLRNLQVVNNSFAGLVVTNNLTFGDSTTVSDCSFSANPGNGIQTIYTTLTVERCTLSGNGGRGIESSVGTALTVRESLISVNGDSGIFVNGFGNSGPGLSQLVANSLTVADNAGDGLELQAVNVSWIADSILRGNHGFGMSADVNSDTVAASFTDFWMNSGGDTNSGITLGQGNLFTDPLFVGGPQGFYYLSQTAAGQGATSPCVDAGDPAAPLVPGTTRSDEMPDQGVLDMGFHHPVN